MNTVTVAAIQCAFSESISENLDRVEGFIEQASKQGAQVILPPELLQGHYFCVEEKEKHFDSAFPVASHPVVVRLTGVAKRLGVVIPASIFERDGQHF